MNEDVVISLLVGAVELAAKLAAPPLLAGLVVGLVVSVFQAIMQIQEATLAFIPKIVAVVVVLVIAGPWMLSEVVGYTHELLDSIPQIVGQ